MIGQKKLTLIMKLLEECLEQEYSLEELRSKIRDILRLIGVYSATETQRHRE